jgi:hypothetical protein
VVGSFGCVTLVWVDTNVETDVVMDVEIDVTVLPVCVDVTVVGTPLFVSTDVMTLEVIAVDMDMTVLVAVTVVVVFEPEPARYAPAPTTMIATTAIAPIAAVVIPCLTNFIFEF